MSAIVLGVFYTQLLEQIAVGSQSSQLLLPEDVQELSDGLPGLWQTLLLWTGILGVVVGLTTTFTGFFMVGKLAGPLSRLKRAAGQLGDGDLSVYVELRAEDDLHDLAESINDAVSRVQLMVMACKEQLDVLNELELSGEDAERLDTAVAGLEGALVYFETIGDKVSAQQEPPNLVENTGADETVELRAY